MRAPAFLALVTLLACNRHKPAEPALDARAPEAPVVKPSASAAPSAAPDRAASPDPLLAGALDGERFAVLLAPTTAGDTPDALTVYAREPIVTIGAPIDASKLDAEGRAHLDGAYVLHGAKGETCDATVEGVALVHRIPADDPTANKDASKEPGWAKETFQHADAASHVALVHATGCKDVLWAAPRSAPAATTVAVKAAPKDMAKKVGPVLAKDDAFQSFKAGGKLSVAYTALGDALVLARARSGPSAGCFVLSTGKKAELVGSAQPCPESVRAATSDGTRTFLWFDHARAVLTPGSGLDIVYFPTASFAASEE